MAAGKNAKVITLQFVNGFIAIESLYLLLAAFLPDSRPAGMGVSGEVSRGNGGWYSLRRAETGAKLLVEAS